MFDFAKTLLNGLECFVRGEVGKLRRRIEAVEKAAAKAGRQIKALRADIEATDADLNNAWSSINSAYNTASNANRAAATAQTTANAAKTAAATAQSTADAANGTANNSVQYVSQNLTPSQKEIARNNIGAGTGTSNFDDEFRHLKGVPFGVYSGDEIPDSAWDHALNINSTSVPATSVFVSLPQGNGLISVYRWDCILDAIITTDSGKTLDYITYFRYDSDFTKTIEVLAKRNGAISTVAEITFVKTSQGIRLSGVLVGSGVDSVKCVIHKLVSFRKINPYLLPIASSISENASGHELASASGVYQFVDSRVQENALMLKSSITDSTKKFKITVDDEGVISATEITA